MKRVNILKPVYSTLLFAFLAWTPKLVKERKKKGKDVSHASSR